eukprot:759540-Prymnesium_polylepis.1
MIVTAARQDGSSGGASSRMSNDGTDSKQLVGHPGCMGCTQRVHWQSGKAGHDGGDGAVR